MRKILAALTFALLTGCAQNKTGSKDLQGFIPENIAVILKLQNPDLFFSNLKNIEFINKNNHHPLAESLREELSIFNLFPHKNPAYLSFSFSNENKLLYTFISRQAAEMDIDSVQNKMVESFTTGNQVIKKYTIEEKVTYTGTRDSVFIFSNSRQLLEKSLSKNSKVSESSDFQKAMKAASSSQPAVFINHKEIAPLYKDWFPGKDPDLIKFFSNWTVVDVDLSENGIKLNGITTAEDSLANKINIFKGVGTAKNLLGQVTPATAKGFFSFTYKNLKALARNLQKHQEQEFSMNSPELQLMETATEAGIIYLEGKEVFAVRTLDQEAASLALASHREEVENFRDLSFYKFSSPTAFQFLQPLLVPKKLQVYTHLNDFVLFSESSEALKNVVIAYQNEQVISKNEAYVDSFKSLSTEASILLVSNNERFKSTISNAVTNEYKKATKDISFTNYPIGALQFIYSAGYAHVHATLTRSSTKKEDATTAQTITVQLGAELATPPVFFKNHRTNGMDVAVQDENNLLYLISPAGRIYWKKQLESRVVGKIHSVDILRNGRYQLAFTTQNRLHVIDRTGREVKPFPLIFKDEITQPLAVFDYYNKRNYRFVVVQGNELYMFNNKGNRVKGFSFSKADEEIILPPKHIRIGRKDYILVQEKSGNLNILSRTGKTRVAIKNKLQISKNEWFEHKDHFTSSTPTGDLIKIDQQGRVKTENVDLVTGHDFKASNGLLVSLSENTLNINEKKITLDFGLYTAPQIFHLNNEHFITVTDIQAHKVYLFNSKGVLLPGFPIYGNSPVDLNNADDDAAFELTVQGDDDKVLLYEILN